MVQMVTTDQGEIAYSVTGSGPPLVLLPGFQSNRTGWLAPNSYPDLLPGHRIINVDPLGHGKSTMSHDQADYNTANVVDHVVAVLDALDVESAHIWGFSRGGLIAALCSELVPDRCRSAVFGAAPIGRAASVILPELIEAEPHLRAGDWESHWATYPAPLPKFLTDHFEKTNDPLACAAIIRALAQWSGEVPGYGLTPAPVPRLAYFGPGEPFADALRDQLVDSTVTVHEGTWPGHAETMLDAEGVVAVVEPFLRAAI